MNFTEWLDTRLVMDGSTEYRRRYMRAKRRDANHKSVGDFLRAQGWSVLDLADHGDGVPDYAIGAPRFACLVEVKDGSKPASARKLTEAEIRVRDRWEGPYVVALSGEDAHAQLTALKGER